MLDKAASESEGREYVAPESLEEVIQLLEQHQEDARLLAGGQSLLVLLRQGLVSPRVLISLKRIKDLQAISFSSEVGMSVGAAVTQAAIERLEPVRKCYTAFSDAIGVVATIQVRNQGTIGGNLCHADPTADIPAALIALGAQLEIVGPGGARSLPVEAFFRDYMEVDLSTAEVLAHIHLPPLAPYSGSAYAKHRLREVDTALVGAGVLLQLDEAGDTVSQARVGLAGAGPTPTRAVDAERVLRGARAGAEALAEAAEAAATACTPLSDTEASEWYRREMVRVLVRRASERALGRARAGAGGRKESGHG